MKRTLSLLALGASALISTNVSAQVESLWRIDCGTGATPMPALNQRFSDTLAFPNLSLTFTFSCYLIKHGNDSVVARLNLSGEPQILTVLSGREKTVRILDDLRREVGDDPEAWMQKLMERA